MYVGGHAVAIATLPHASKATEPQCCQNGQTPLQNADTPSVQGKQTDTAYLPDWCNANFKQVDVTWAGQITRALHVAVIRPELFHSGEAPHQLHILFILLCRLSSPALRALRKAKGVAVLELMFIWSCMGCLLVRLL